MLRDNIFPDIQKFIGTLNLVNDSHPTGGLTAKEYHCMAIAIHLNLTKKVDYDFCDNKPRSFNPAERWPNYLAFLVVKDQPKFMEAPTCSQPSPCEPSPMRQLELTTDDINIPKNHILPIRHR